MAQKVTKIFGLLLCDNLLPKTCKNVNTIDVKNDPSVGGAGIQTHNLTDICIFLDHKTKGSGPELAK